MHDSEYNLATLAISQGADIHATIALLQKTWNVPNIRFRLRKADDEDDDGRSTAGNHKIPEIGRQEQAFYDALTDGQKAAYRALKTLIDDLFEANGGSWAGVDPWSIGDPIDDWKRQVFNDLAARPMQAYLVGQMLAQEHLEAGLPRPMLPTDRRAIEFLDHYAFNEIDDAFSGLKSDLRNALIQGMQAGDNPRDVARRFSTTLEDYETRWDLIAITETARAESQGRLNELNDEGYAYAIGSSAHDARTCDDCLRLVNDVVVKVEDVISVSNYGRKKADWESCIPLHPRCVVEGSEVLTPFGRKRIERVRPGDYVLSHTGNFRRVLATASREHSGIIFDVDGLRVTGEHPVLTPSGFRLATNLDSISDVLRISRISWLETRPDETHDTPTECRENRSLGRVLRDLSGRPLMPTASVNFDGKFALDDSKVDIEAINSELRVGLDPEELEFLEHRLFEMAHRASCLVAKSSLKQKFVRLRRASRRIMRGSNLRRSLLATHARPLNGFGFRLASRLEVMPLEREHDLRSSEARTFGNGVHRFSALMSSEEFQGLFQRELVPSIDSVRIVDSLFTGHVYDLQVSEDESFIANGIAVHNCRCVWLPYQP